jgi:hypothetical protein
MHVVLPSFPRRVGFWDCGSGRGEEPSGAKVLRLIQIRLATSSFEKISLAGQDKNVLTIELKGLSANEILR